MRVRESFRESLARQGSLSEAKVVQALAQAFVNGPLSDDEHLRHSQLMTREMTQPTKAFEHVDKQVIQPLFKEVSDHLDSLLSNKVGEEQMLLDIFSIFAMVLYFNFARVAVSRLTGRKYDSTFRARLVEQITQFSLRGLGVGKMEEQG
ncbi:MAG: DUF1956 domain-containing protein [Deltaproteobacteria bacterium]|nr:DUF1956 domain-containing protein [Deltaproteobacteria bacterium]